MFKPNFYRIVAHRAEGREDKYAEFNEKELYKQTLI